MSNYNPQPPEELVDALNDPIHVESISCRPAYTARKRSKNKNMRIYKTLTKAQLVKWLNNFDDETLIAAFDFRGNTVTKIELCEDLVFNENTQFVNVLSIKGRE